MYQNFLENLKNCQNHDIFEGAVMGRRIYPTRIFWSRILSNLSEICSSKRMMWLFNDVKIRPKKRDPLATTFFPIIYSM